MMHRGSSEIVFFVGQQAFCTFAYLYVYNRDSIKYLVLKYLLYGRSFVVANENLKESVDPLIDCICRVTNRKLPEINCYITFE